ncbi:hypothetical protein ACOSQ2_004634 [Xanthoceras sorbifolium]
MVVFFLGFFIGRRARGNRFFGAQKRFQSNYFGSLARRGRDADEASEVAHLREIYRRNDPEVVIRQFESQPSLHHNQSALSEYVKALVRVDRLNDSELLKTLQRGPSGFRYTLLENA